MIKTFGTVVFNTDGDILLVRHERGAGHVTGVYGLPVGRSEEGESPIETAIREAQEEAGIHLVPEELIELPKEYTADIPRKDGTIKSFSMRVYIKDKYNGDIREGDEETTPEWVPESKLNGLDLLPNVQSAILASREVLGTQK